jgi:hypothetical protein
MVPEEDINRIDDLVLEGMFPNANQAVLSAIRDLFIKSNIWPLKQNIEHHRRLKTTNSLLFLIILKIKIYL